MSLIQDLFGRSPVRPMQQHMATAVNCAREIMPLFEAMAAGETASIPALRARVDDLEHEADRIKNEIRGHLPKRLFMAFERRDMLEILHSQDSIADTAQDIAELVDQRAMVLPAVLRDSALELVRRSIAACEQAERIVNELDELVETGFRGREVSRVEQMIDELNRLESDTDDLQDRAIRQLFAAEAELGVATFFWWELLGWVADLADHAEKVGNRLRLLIAV
jgi:predicted phosphate transport protein (TIGR00153 family)